MHKQIYNPFLPEGEYCPDGEPHVFDGRLYLYSSRDKFGSMRYCPGDYLFWSAPTDDLRSWTPGKTAYKRRGRYNATGFRCMWAPDCAQGGDGRYYLYFCFDFDNKICVAVADKPDGPFGFYGIVRHADGTYYGRGKNDIMCFDPAVFRDDDGFIYLYSGYSANEDLRRMLNRRGIKNVDGTGCRVVRLDDDMLTVKSEPRQVIPGYKNSAGTGFEGHEMYEGASMRKFGGRYYFIYSSRLSRELAYAVSEYPDRGFRYGGALISNGDIGYNGRTEKDALYYWGNVHGSIAETGGRYYVFYHRQTNKNEQTRQACAEELKINSDGSIDTVEMTSCGLNGGPLVGEGVYPAYIACNLRSANGAVKCAYGPFARRKYKEHPCITEYAKGRQCIRNMRDGAQAGFKYFEIRGETKVSVTTRGAAGKLFISATPLGAPLAAIELSASQRWKSESAAVPFAKGKTALYFTYAGSGSIDFVDFCLTPTFDA